MAKKKAFDLETKYRAICEVDRKQKTQQQVANELGCRRSTVNGWFKEEKKEKIIKAFNDCVTSSRKKLRAPKHHLVDESLFEWFKKMRALNVPINGPMMEAKAEQLAALLSDAYEDCSTFKASKGWLHRFKRRYKNDTTTSITKCAFNNIVS